MNDVLAIAKALADVSRLRILICLEGSTLCLCQLTEILDLAPSTVSKHLSVLHEAGLVAWRRESRWRYYRWVEEGASGCVKDALAWVRSYAVVNETVKADFARREIVMQTSIAPCPSESKARVLFLCTGNSCRSQMAEALLRYYSGRRFEIYSAGLDPRGISELTYQVMDEKGIDIHGQQSKGLTDLLGKVHFGHLITVCPNAESRCPIFPGVSHRLYWPVEDPEKVSGSLDKRLEAFRCARDEIAARIQNWLAQQGILSTEPAQVRINKNSL